jgi:hypothetical protein
LLFGEALCFGVCLGVGYGFFSTRPAWLYVEAGAVWMWKHVSFALEKGSANKQRLLLSHNRPPLQKAGNFQHLMAAHSTKRTYPSI